MTHLERWGEKKRDRVVLVEKKGSVGIYPTLPLRSFGSFPYVFISLIYSLISIHPASHPQPNLC